MLNIAFPIPVKSSGVIDALVDVNVSLATSSVDDDAVVSSVEECGETVCQPSSKIKFLAGTPNSRSVWMPFNIPCGSTEL